MSQTKIHRTRGGELAPCNAGERACPLGGKHYESMEDAVLATNDTKRRQKLADSEIKEKNAAIKKQNMSFGSLGEERAKKTVTTELIAIKEKMGGEFNHILLCQDREEELEAITAHSYEQVKARNLELIGEDRMDDPALAYNPRAPYNGVSDPTCPEDYCDTWSATEKRVVEAELHKRIEERDPARFQRWEKLENPADFYKFLDEQEYRQVVEEISEFVRTRHLTGDEGHRHWILAQQRLQGNWEKRIRAEYLYGERGNE